MFHDTKKWREECLIRQGTNATNFFFSNFKAIEYIFRFRITEYIRFLIEKLTKKNYWILRSILYITRLVGLNGSRWIESRWIGDASRLAKSRTIAGLLIVEEMGE